MAPVSCKTCASLGAKTKYWTLDDRKTHAQFHVSQVGYISVDGEQTSVKEIFGKCFPSDDFEKSTKIDKTRSTLFEICKHIIADKKNETKSIECQICDSDVRYISKGNQRTDYILLHAGTHSTKQPFVCRECQHESATRSNVVYHIKNFHRIASPISGVHFVENWIVCFDEVKESLTKCFGGLNPTQRSSTKIRTPLGELSTQRRVIFKKILKNTKSKKIQCRQCQVEICAKCSANLEDHVRFHLQQRIYECAMCDDTFIHKPNITTHLIKKHDVRPKGNYIDHSDEHHETIMECAKKCFVKKEGK